MRSVILDLFCFGCHCYTKKKHIGYNFVGGGGGGFNGDHEFS